MAKRTKCPVCGSLRLPHTMKMHITQTSQRELAKSFEIMIDCAKGKPYNFSPMVALRQMPHTAFRRRNMKGKKVFEFNS
jgi:hypothetical protein